MIPDRLTLLPLPTLRGERVILRGRRESDIDDRLRHPIDPEEEDGYGSSWRRSARPAACTMSMTEVFGAANSTESIAGTSIIWS